MRRGRRVACGAISGFVGRKRLLGLLRADAITVLGVTRRCRHGHLHCGNGGAFLDVRFLHVQWRGVIVVAHVIIVLLVAHRRR